MIEWARNSIQIYAQYLKDEQLLNVIKKQADKWVKIEIVLSKNWYRDYVEKNDICWVEEVSDKQCREFIHENIIVWTINNKAKMHSKAILVDSKYLFIGSINVSTSSIDKNREMWILLTNRKIIQKFLEIFTKDSSK